MTSLTNWKSLFWRRHKLHFLKRFQTVLIQTSTEGLWFTITAPPLTEDLQLVVKTAQHILGSVMIDSLHLWPICSFSFCENASACSFQNHWSQAYFLPTGYQRKALPPTFQSGGLPALRRPFLIYFYVTLCKILLLFTLRKWTPLWFFHLKINFKYYVSSFSVENKNLRLTIVKICLKSLMREQLFAS